MKPHDRLAAGIAALVLQLRREVDGWWIHRTTSDRWLAIRETTCIRAVNAVQLREQLRHYTAESAGQNGGDES